MPWDKIVELKHVKSVGLQIFDDYSTYYGKSYCSFHKHREGIKR